MTESNYEFSEFGITVSAKISTHEDFIDCSEFVKTPFSDSTTILPNNFDYDSFDRIVIRCFLTTDEASKILQSSQQPQSFCVKILEKYAEEKLSNKRQILYKTLTCNPNESQFMYLIAK